MVVAIKIDVNDPYSEIKVIDNANEIEEKTSKCFIVYWNNYENSVIIDKAQLIRVRG